MYALKINVKYDFTLEDDIKMFKAAPQELLNAVVKKNSSGVSARFRTPA